MADEQSSKSLSEISFRLMVKVFVILSSLSDYFNCAVKFK